MKPETTIGILKAITLPARTAMPLAIISALVLLCPGKARGGMIITALKVGEDVVFRTDGGGLDLTAWYLSGGGSGPSSSVGISPFGSFISFGNAFPEDSYLNPFGVTASASSFGPGRTTSADSTSGPTVQFNRYSGTGAFLTVPKGYLSGAPLPVSTMTFEGASYETLGIAPGVYEWTWGSPDQSTADFLRLEITPPSGSVPDGGTSIGLMGLALLSLAVGRKQLFGDKDSAWEC